LLILLLLLLESIVQGRNRIRDGLLVELFVIDNLDELLHIINIDDHANDLTSSSLVHLLDSHEDLLTQELLLSTLIANLTNLLHGDLLRSHLDWLWLGLLDWLDGRLTGHDLLRLSLASNWHHHWLAHGHHWVLVDLATAWHSREVGQGDDGLGIGLILNVLLLLRLILGSIVVMFLLVWILVSRLVVAILRSLSLLVVELTRAAMAVL